MEVTGTPTHTPTPVTVTEFVAVTDERVVSYLGQVAQDTAYMRGGLELVLTFLVVLLLIVIAHYLYKFLKMFL